MTDTRTVWEQTGKKPKTRFGDIIPCEGIQCRWTGTPAVDRWEHPDDSAYHLCAKCSIRLGTELRTKGWKRIGTWVQPLLPTPDAEYVCSECGREYTDWSAHTDHLQGIDGLNCTIVNQP